MRATVVIPTHGNRGPLLSYSIGSVQRQTLQDFEIFVIGDGVTDATRRAIRDLQTDDSRIRFFDHPKHERRGETYRHEAFREARGDFVAYLCDRDLMLPNHLETLARLLQTANFAKTLMTRVHPNGRVEIFDKFDLSKPRHVKLLLAPRTGYGLGLSFVGHSLEMYRALPHGWRTTPVGIATDHYMWQQFLAHPDCRPASRSISTILYFGRRYLPASGGGTVPQWEAELREWSRRSDDTAWTNSFQQGIENLNRSLATRMVQTVKRRIYASPNLLQVMYRFPRFYRVLLSVQRRLAGRTKY